MSKASLETTIRNDFIDNISTFIDNWRGADVLRVSASEITVPVVDEEGNEKFVLIKISVPRGTRNGDGGYDPYDGYAAAEDYRLELDDKAAKKAASAEKKAAAEKEKERKRAAKQTVKKLNEIGLDAMIHENEDEDDPNQFLPHEVSV